MNGVSKKHQCQHCDAGFTLNIFLQNHLKDAHVENGQYRCGECSCRFADLDKFDSHMAQQHGYQPNIKAKRPSDEDSSLRCQRCRITFHNAAMLKSHMRQKHPDDEESSDEEDEFEDEEDLKPAEVSKPSEEINLQQRKSPPPPESKPEDKCKFCKKIFHNEAMLRSHLRQKHADELESSEDEADDDDDDYEPNFPPGELIEDEQTESAPVEDISTQSASISAAQVPDLSSRDEDRRDYDSHASRSLDDRTAIESRETETVSQSMVIEPPVEDNNKRNHEENSNLADSQQNEQASPMYSPAAGNDDEDDDGYFPTPTDFLAQTEYEMDEQESAVRSSNIEALINSIGHDPEEPISYACDLCGSVYATAHSLQNHKKTNHVDGGQFPCSSCSSVFASKPELVVHAEIVHRVIQQQQLQQQQLHTPDFGMTMSAADSIMPCDLCFEKFTDGLELTIHKMRCHVPDGNSCEYCPCSFMTFNELREHQRSHSEFSDIQIIPGTIDVPSPISLYDPSKEFYCMECNVDYKSKASLRNHMRQCHVPNGQHACDFCPCVFGTRSSLVSHKKKHNRERLERPVVTTPVRTAPTNVAPKATPMDSMQIYTCELCGVNFLSVSDYLKHKEESHVVGGTFACDICSCVFDAYEALKTHQNVFHVGFTRSSSRAPSQAPQPVLPRILQRSSGKTSITCEICGAITTNQRYYDAHKQKSHVEGGYACKLCPRSYATFHAIRTHLGMYHKQLLQTEPIESMYTLPNGVSPPRAGTVNGTSKRGRNSKATVVNDVASEFEFKCNECDWILSDVTDLQNHKIQFHGFKPNTKASQPIDEVTKIIQNDDDLTCSACNLKFKRPSETFSHRKRNHVPGGKFPCTSCKCVFSNAAALQAHDVAKHGDNLSTSPTKRTPTKSLPTTSSSKNDKEHVCNLCGRSYPMLSTLCAHKNRSHKPGGKQCDYCTCTFSSQGDLGLHCKKYHRQVKFAADLADVARRGRGRPKRDKSARFSCQYNKCGLACRTQSSLTSHIKTVHAGPIEVVTIDLDSEEAAAPVSASAVRCEQCRIGFDTKQELASHRISVHEYDVIKMAIESPSMDENGKYLCHFCSTVFARFTAMVAHVKSYHGDENRLMCFECKEEFPSMTKLDLHRERAHGGIQQQVQEREEVEEVVPIIMSCTSLSLSGYEKPKQPKCELCGRVFLHSRSLWAHRKRSHVTDGEHGCEHCTCGFGTLRGLQSHQLIYHGIRPEKKEKDDSWMIDCDECPETFTSNRAFKTHKRRAHWEGENGVSCPDCYCTLASQAAMTVHRIRIHGYELPQSGDGSGKSTTEVVESAKDISTVQDTTQDYDDDYSEPQFDDHFDDGPPEPSYEPIPSESHDVEPEDVIVESNLNGKVQGDQVSDAPAAPARHACGSCRMTFGQLKFLGMHRKLRHGIEDNLCWICKEECSTLQGLLDHVQSHETLEPAAPPESSPITKPATLAAKKSYATNEEKSCDICGLEFTLPAALNMHKTVAHVRGGKYPCKECPCVFGSGGSLSNHARSHSKRKTTTRTQAASSRSRKSTSDSGGGSASTKSKPVAKKKTSLPPPGKSDIIGLALSAAMASTTPVDVPEKVYEPLKPSCATCKKTDFPTLSSLRRHESECRKKAKSEKIFGSRPTLNCKLCTKKFTLAVALQDHMKKKHGIGADAPEVSENVQPIDISEDRKAKGPKGSRRATKVQAPPPRPPTPPPPPPKKKTKFPCRDCNIIYKRKRVRDNHLMICHPVNGNHACDKCPFKFRLPLALMIHQKYTHGDRALKKKKKKTTKRKVIKKADSKPAQTVEVNGVDTTQTTVTTEVNRVEDKQQTLAEPQVTTGPEKTTTEGQVNGLVSPAIASTAPSGTGDASAAVKKPDEAQVNGETKTKVKRKKRKRRTEKGFFSPQALRSRDRLISWTEVMHPCKVCAMKFRRTSQLERHERINHPGYSEYLCEKCPSMTALSKELKYHEEIYHSQFMSMGEAMERRQRKRKMLSNNNDETTVGRPKKIIKLRPLRLDESLPLDLSNVIASFTCPGPIVQKNLRDRENFLRRKLKRRKGIHMCRVCRMMFFTKRGLSAHLNIHVGDKPFKCRFCGVLFRRYSSYHSHKKKHIAMNPRLEVMIKREPLGRCSYCKETFRTVALADIHFEEVHPELKFLDMCEQASNLWKETTSVLNSVADNPSPNPTPAPQQLPLPSMPSLI